MTRPGWATAEERDFLLSLMPEYEACQVKRRYKAFWQRVNAKFLSKFPVIDKLFPGRKVTDLTPEQKELLTTNVQKQQKRLKEWYRWQTNPRSRTSGGVISKKDLHSIYNGRSRTHKPSEVFAKLYAEEVEAEKVKRCKAEGVSGRQMLHVWHEVVKEMYESATEEQRVAVKQRMAEEEAEAQKEEDEGDSPESFIRHLKKLPLLLGATITPAVRKAGVIAFVTIVGPNPEQDGKIMCQSLQFGDQPNTPVFSQVWSSHDSIYVEELARFVRRHEFSPEVCVARSLRAVKLPKEASTEPKEDVQEDELEAPTDVGQQGQKTQNQLKSARPVETPQKSTPPAVVGNDGSPASTHTISSRQDSFSSKSSTFSPLSEGSHPQSSFPSSSGEEGSSGGEVVSWAVNGDGLPNDGGDSVNMFEAMETWDLGDVDWSSVDFSLKNVKQLNNGQHDLSASLQSFPDLLPAAPTSLPPIGSSTAGHQSADLRSRLSDSADIVPPTNTVQTSAASSGNYGLGTLRISSPPPMLYHSSFGQDATSPAYPTTHAHRQEQSLLQQSTQGGFQQDGYFIGSQGYFSGNPRSSVATGHLTSAESQSFPYSSGSSHSVGFSASLVPPPPNFSIATTLSQVPHASESMSSLLTSSTFDAVSKQGTFPTSSVRFEPSPAHSSGVPYPPSYNSTLQGNSQPYGDLFGASSPGMCPQFAPSGQQASPLSPLTSPRNRPLPGLIESASQNHPLANGDLQVPSASSATPLLLPPASRPPEGSHSQSAASAKLNVLHSTPHPPENSPHLSTLTSVQGQQEPGFDGPQSGQQANPTSPALPKRTCPSEDSQVAPSLPSLIIPPSISEPSAPTLPTQSAPPQEPADNGNHDASLEPREDAGCRRSNRGSIPSKRNDQLQRIGSNAVSLHIEDSTPPAWFVLAKENLDSYELGAQWKELVEKWSVLESSMGYGKNLKGSLPTRSRPDEWTKWTSKTWQGTRRYDKVPKITDPADLGIATTKWWSSFQPSFRASPTGFPPPIYSSTDVPAGTDAWVALRKSGPNGFISLVMLLAWWGHAAKNNSSCWGEDSRPAWNRLTQDVIRVLEAMHSSANGPGSLSGSKRPLLNKENNAPIAHKRTRV